MFCVEEPFDEASHELTDAVLWQQILRRPKFSILRILYPAASISTE
jgi:hypothetical protein